MVARITPTLGACSGSLGWIPSSRNSFVPNISKHISLQEEHINKTTRLKHRSFACLDHFRSKSDKRLFNMAKQPSYEG